jgi:serine/threonine-protein kinase
MVAQGTSLAGRYRLDERLGAGGMGEVWRGEDMVLARTVAVKLLLPDRMNDPNFVQRFQNEARAMATINHPGVVDVYDYGVTEVPGDGPTAFLVMRFVDGEPLDRLLTRLGRIAPEPAMDLIAQAADALQAVHEKGIVHRDVKPGNLMVRSDGRLVLTDFGIARAESANRLTDAGIVLGTAAYCAPEQAEGQPVTPAVDIYALGVVAYECLAGMRPFDGDSPVTIALKHIREAPPPLPPDIPAPVRHVVERALAKDPGSRWPSAAAMGQAARQAALAAGGAAPMPGEAGVQPATGYGEQPYPGTPAPSQPFSQQYSAPFSQPYPQQQYAEQAYPQAPYPPEDAAPAPNPPERRGAPARARRRGGRAGLFTGIGVGAALFGGLAAFALNGVAATGTEEPPPTAVGPTATDPGTKAPVRATTESPRPTRPRPRNTPTKAPPTRQPTPTAEPTPTRTASPTPSPTKPTATPSKTPALRKVPSVVGLSEPAAIAVLRRAGFTHRVIISTDPDTGMCTKVLSQDPAANEVVPSGTVISIVVDRGTECPGDDGDESPTPTPTPTPTGSPAPAR